MTDIKMQDVTGTPRPERQILEAIQYLEKQIVTDPMAMAKDGTPRIMVYLTMKDALKELLMLRRLLDTSGRPAATAAAVLPTPVFDREAPTHPGKANAIPPPAQCPRPVRRGRGHHLERNSAHGHGGEEDMNNVMFILMGMVGGLIAHLIEHAHKRWRIKQLAKDELKTLSKETVEDKMAREDAKARREFIQSQVDEVLDERLKDPAGTGKILDYAASYLHDRAKEHKNIDWHMLERIKRICRAGSEHLRALAPPERISTKWEKDKSQEKKDAASVQ
jgi:hypothetical protein